MIEDRMEEGLSEEEAVEAIGPAETIISQIIGGTPLVKLVKERVKPKHKLKAWEITLLALGSPLWISLVLAFICIALSLYIVLWSCVAALWAADLSLAISGAVSIPVGIITYVIEGSIPGSAMIACALISAGLGILMFPGCKAVSKGTLRLTGKITHWIKSLLMRKENDNNADK